MPYHFQDYAPSWQHPAFFTKHPIRGLYVGDAIKGFGFGMIAIFAPVYYYTVFAAAGFTNPIAMVLLSYVFMDTLFLVGTYTSVRYLERFGFRKFMLVAYVALILHFILLIQMKEHILLVIPALVSAALYRSLFWPGYHILFARHTVKGHRGEAVGNRIALLKLVGIAAPLLGGIIVASFGFTPLIIIVAAIVSFAVIPYMTVDLRVGHRGGPKPILKELHKRGGTSATFAMIAKGAVFIIAAIAWPLYLFLLDIGLRELGAITSAATAVTVVTLYLVGRYSDKHEKRLLNVGSVLYSLTWILRAAAQGVWSAFTANSLANLTGSAMSIPFDAHIYDRLQGESPNEQVHLILFRELSVNTGRVLIGLVGAAFVLIGGSLQWLMLLAIPLSLIIPLVARWSTEISAERRA